MIKPLRVTSFNIHKDMSPLNRKVNLVGIANELEGLDADLLFAGSAGAA